MRFLFDYPWYFSLFCLLAGILYAVALYWHRRKEDSFSPKVTWILAAVRGIVVTLISLLLLAPLVRRQVQEPQKPIVVVAHDVSQSIPEIITPEQLLPESDAFEVVHYAFGSDIEPYSDSSSLRLGGATNLSNLLDQLRQRYAGRNLGAVVLATDGICNQGAEPTAMARQLGVPLFPVALGDTVNYPDASIAHLRCNRVAYLDSRFPVEVTVSAHRLKGRHATLTVSRKNQQLYSQPLVYDENTYAYTASIMLDADKPGLQTYTVSLSVCDGELTDRNNIRTLAVEVIDGRRKIALLAAAPHPDVSALRQSIESNANYQVDVFVGSDIGKAPLGAAAKKTSDDSYSLVIYHGLPTAQFAIPNTQLPSVYVLSSSTDIPRFNTLHLGLEVMVKNRKSDEAVPRRNASFALFNFSDELASALELMPPLQSPFGTYRLAANTQVMLWARIGQVVTDRPLIAFGQNEGVRTAFVAGDGLWRWRLQDYLAHSNHEIFNQLVEKIVVYTSLQHTQERFHVSCPSVFSEGESVTLEAELYNDAFEPINTPDVQCQITAAESGNVSDYHFYRKGSGYLLNVGVLPPGTYRYAAQVQWQNKTYAASGNFVVEHQGLEQLCTVADHTLLSTLASLTGGQMLYPDQCDEVEEILKSRSDMKSIIYSQTRYTDLLNTPWLLVLIVLLLSFEWAVRKYNGRI